MLEITLQDLRYRFRRFVIAVAGTSLVFAMALLLSGLAAGFTQEIQRTVGGFGAATWVVSSGATGRVAGLAPIPSGEIETVRSTAGAGRVAPVVVSVEGATFGSTVRDVALIGTVPGALGAPDATTGSDLRTRGQAVVDDRLGLRVGAHFEVSGLPLVVVGTISGRTLLGGDPDVYVTLADAQAVALGGRPLVSAILATGTPRTLPAALKAESASQITAASLLEMSVAQSSISNTKILMWVIAVVIVAALVYVSALERTRDFAVLKALGATSGSLFGGLAMQAVVITIAAAAVADVIANFMGGLFAQPVDIPASAFVYLPLAAVVIGLLASLAALRRAVSVDPAMAFGGP